MSALQRRKTAWRATADQQESTLARVRVQVLHVGDDVTMLLLSRLFRHRDETINLSFKSKRLEVGLLALFQILFHFYQIVKNTFLNNP